MGKREVSGTRRRAWSLEKERQTSASVTRFPSLLGKEPPHARHAHLQQAQQQKAALNRIIRFRARGQKNILSAVYSKSILSTKSSTHTCSKGSKKHTVNVPDNSVWLRSWHDGYPASDYYILSRLQQSTQSLRKSTVHSVEFEYGYVNG